jgi:hypothetical protein
MSQAQCPTCGQFFDSDDHRNSPCCDTPLRDEPIVRTKPAHTKTVDTLDD